MPKKELDTFSVSYLSILDEDGNVDKDLEPKLKKPELIELYRQMVWARRTDERMLKLQRQGRIGTFGPSTGQEAAQCAVAFAMRKQDWFAGAFREHGVRLLRGESLTRQLVYYNGQEEGNINEGSANPRNLPISVIVGAQPLHAVGLAYAMRLQGETETCAVTFMGDGATSEGDFHEAMNFAAVWNLPVLFVVQNNQWAISVPVATQAKVPLYRRADGYGIPGAQIDGNDVLASFAATRAALDSARAGEGPQFIEAVTYRMGAHTTSDDPTKYRRRDEEHEWAGRDPIARFGSYLRGRGASEHFFDEVDEAAREYANDTRVRTLALQPPEAETMFAHVYSEPHPRVQEQREWRRQYEATFDVTAAETGASE